VTGLSFADSHSEKSDLKQKCTEAGQGDELMVRKSGGQPGLFELPPQAKQASFPRQPGKPAPERSNQSGF